MVSIIQLRTAFQTHTQPVTGVLKTSTYILGNQFVNNLSYEFFSDNNDSPYSLWARATYFDFNGDPKVNGRRLKYEGDSLGLFVGGDVKLENNWRLGLAAGREIADIKAALHGDGIKDDTIDRRLFMVLPYADWTHNDYRVRLALGYGLGDVEVKSVRNKAVASTKSDLEWWMASLSGKRSIRFADSPWDIQLSAGLSTSRSKTDKALFRNARNIVISRFICC